MMERQFHPAEIREIDPWAEPLESIGEPLKLEDVVPPLELDELITAYVTRDLDEAQSLRWKQCLSLPGDLGEEFRAASWEGIHFFRDLRSLEDREFLHSVRIEVREPESSGFVQAVMAKLGHRVGLRPLDPVGAPPVSMWERALSAILPI